MLTVFRILFGKNAKVGNRSAYKGSSLSFFKPYNHRLSKFFRGFRQKFGGQLWGREKIKAKN